MQFRNIIIIPALMYIVFISGTSCSKDTALLPEEQVADSGTIIIEGGGDSYGNKVFVDLSADKQTGILRTAWDLGFYTGEEFRVILNSSTGMMARALVKSDLNEVTAADTLGFSAEMSFSAFSTDALPYIDYPDGDLTKTAIAEISASSSDNKVYIVNGGTDIGIPPSQRGWKKIRVIRSSSGGYTLQYADIDASSFQELQVAKTGTHFFSYVSFQNGAVTVEPEKDKWDIAWTYFSNVTSFGAGEIPYGFQDFVLQNRNTGSALVLTNSVSYEDFSEADIAGLVFGEKQNAIGADWRVGGGPNTSPSVKTDRFYIIRDAAENYYKLRFTSLTKNGERGYPSFEFDLVRKGA